MINQSLLELYASPNLSLLDATNHVLTEILLHNSCPERSACWGDPNCVTDEMDWNKISLPYIGPKYMNSQFRLLVIGENLNHDGGLVEVHRLSVLAQYQLAAGKKCVYFTDSDKHIRSVFWHRLAAYAAIILRDDLVVSHDQVSYRNQRLEESTDTLAKSMDHIAFLNLVKCSPSNGNSSPTQVMLERCPRLVTLQEIKLLNPTCIMTLGRTVLDNLWPALDPSCRKIDDDRKRWLYMAKFGDREIPILGTLHPTYPQGGPAPERVVEFANLVLNNRQLITQLG
jgi:hypothetical protein